MSNPTFRRRGVTALLTVLLTGSAASWAMGQSVMANPRFRRRAPLATPQMLTQASKNSREFAVPRQPQSNVRSSTTRQTPPPAAGQAADQSHRARQALWHAQTARERHAVSAAGAPPARTFGFRPKHERMLGLSPRASNDVVNVQNEAIIQVPMQGGVLPEPTPAEPPNGYYAEGEPIMEGSMAEGESIIGGEPFVEGEGWEGDLAYEYGNDGCDCHGGCFNCMGNMPPPALYGMGDVTLFFGKQGFINGLNQGASGSFGYNGGFNIGTAMPFFPCSGWGFQFGLRGTQSNRSGSAQTNQRRDQTFVTTGIFRRAPRGLQGGIVIDVLRDDWVGNISLTQIRGELGWVKNIHEFGYTFAASNARDSIDPGLVSPQTLSVVDVQGLYYRIKATALPGATGRFVAGWSNNSDGLLLGETQIPMSRHFSLLTTASYLIPNERRGFGGAENEVWNLGMNLVFSFRGAAAHCSAPFAPLFRVADNGSFFVDSN